MIRRLRNAFGGGTSSASDAAVGRGMADVLAALDNVIDDDAALARICARIGMPGSAITTARATGPAASLRRPALRAVAGVAAALTAGAVALAAVVVAGARHNGMDTTAYVVQRVDRALSAAGPAAIAQMTVKTGRMRGGATATTTTEEWSYGGRWRWVVSSPAGHPVYDEGSGTSSVYTLVSYRTRTWARQPWPGRPVAQVSGPRSCQTVDADILVLFRAGLPGAGFSASSLPAARALRTAISCGTLAVAGRQRVDGIEAIELTSRPDSPVSETIWVSPGTYLPVRVVVRSVPGQPVLLTADISWLPPTAQNLARLTVPIPAAVPGGPVGVSLAGFRRVPLARALTQVLQQIRGGPTKAGARPPG